MLPRATAGTRVDVPILRQSAVSLEPQFPTKPFPPVLRKKPIECMRRIFVPLETYLFIDGAYFRKVADEYMLQLFGVPAEIDYRALRRGGLNPRRVFYYDCLNDIQKNGESNGRF
jgi:hypothetical protein